MSLSDEQCEKLCNLLKIVEEEKVRAFTIFRQLEQLGHNKDVMHMIYKQSLPQPTQLIQQVQPQEIPNEDTKTGTD
jgi:dsDNA-binding SOS-regulon protein